MAAGWNQTVFAYCERGLDPAFWAEPLNAASNLAFFAAALAGWSAWAQRPKGQRGSVELALVVVVVLIAIGSFLFHTLATRWAGVADTVPIGIFMVTYLVYALRRFVRLGWWATGLAFVIFVASLPGASMVRCGGGPCLNGSVAYLPALVALTLVGGILIHRDHKAGWYMIAAAALFFVSLALRSIDRSVCPYTFIVASRALGTHFLWHILNAALLYLLLRAAMIYGRPAAQHKGAGPIA